MSRDPGPLRDLLVAAILDGSKTSTTGLVAAYGHAGEPLPEPGRREVFVDSPDRPVAVIEATAVRVAAPAEVDLAHAVDEGEGSTSVAEPRAGHELFRHGAGRRAALDEPEFTVDDATPALLERFRVVTVLSGVDR
ncbi:MULTISPECIES: ASCH domain-containing protein [Streptomyces]|uniref:ASCH domain-containing protein n=1 Tax=Streptomyces lienomycini TaxID=284035 RepID=A0ABV9WU29_9ACTN|nr:MULTISPECIES: ASCH domain-containing protein [Streptomyces]